MAELKLEKVLGGSYYCSGRLSVGVYCNEDDKSAILIDSGIDADTAKKIDKAIVSLGYTILAVINTHGHADHCGGNGYFQKKYRDLKVYATAFEKHFIEDPFLEPFCFCTGAAPIKELRTKFLEADASIVSHVIPYKDDKLRIGSTDFGVITLPGHTPGLIGILTPDEVLYFGDAAFGRETFEKHGILFYTDIADTLKTFEKLKQIRAKAFVAYHGGQVDDLQYLVEKHQKKIDDVCTFVLQTITKSPLSFDALTHRAMEKYGVPSTVIEHVLTATCTRAYVSYLQARGDVVLGVENGAFVIKHAQHTAYSVKQSDHDCL